MVSNGATAPEQARPDAPSPGRPRHDNDRCHITGIHIMPTYGEITSGAAPYLPAADPASWPLPGASGRFDREFRLLREDTAGQIRDACQEVLKAVRGPGIDAYRRQRTSTHFDVCDDAELQHITMDRKHGIKFIVACKQPEPTRSMTHEERRAWWVRCKRFRSGTVVCVFDRAGMILHFVVSGSTLRGPEDAPDDFPMDKHKFNLSNGEEWAYVILELVESSKLGDALRWYRDTERTRYLLDFPELALASFKDTLEALQRQCQSPHSLVNLLNPLTRPAVEIPAYARAPGFEFNLDCLMHDGQTFRFDPRDVPMAMTRIARISPIIDMGTDQVNALLQSLSSEVALIYGRPGTGKSHLARKIIKAFVHNRENADIGPVICIFHNNSALDRMVGQLLDDGIDRIVRMGGQSDSERLESLNLPTTRYTAMRRQERRAEKQTARFLDKLVSDIEGQLLQLSDIDSPWKLDSFLSRAYPESREEVFGPRRGDFSDYQPSTVDAFQGWLNGEASLLDEGFQVFGELEETLHSERRCQHQKWLKDMRDHIIEELTRSYEEYEAIRAELPRFHEDARRQILQGAQVVALTTTELARYPELLQIIQAKVLICDDAGEFLESQTLTAIFPSTEHIILIGDNQLLPKVQTEKLQRTRMEGITNALDVSLFQRLLDMTYDLCPRVPLSTLPLQRRMRPSIAWLTRLVRDTGLGNDDLVRTFPGVVGVRPPLFWLDHRYVDSWSGSIQDEDFSLDYFDIEMVTAMVIHLVRQGHYRRRDIAVITPSLSQLRQLFGRMETEDSFTTEIDDCDLEGLWEINPSEHHEHGGYNCSVSNGRHGSNAGTASLGRVRLATLDSFRGQQAKVVIIPLGRCSSQRALDSMRASNRIDVLLSRAQHGCYILGDSSSYNKEPAWRRIINTLEAGGNLGDSLELRCTRHPDEIIRVSGPDDFKLASPDGGCSQPCGRQLDCGHDCRRSCHSKMMHKLTQCGEPCPRPKPLCEHACALTCGEDCEGSCNQVMDNIDLRLPCGHILQPARCWQVQNPAGVHCMAAVEYKVPGCDHEVTIPCYQTDPQSPSFRCPAKCGAALPCGHMCQRKCHECNFRYHDTFLKAIHDLCDQPCGRSRPDCAHSCQRTCHGPDSECGPCQQPCDIRCSHGKCEKLCHEPCLPCTEEHCASSCPHSKCTMPCAAPCNWVPCSRRCTLLLDCGHQCPSLCGEACPDSRYCQICGSEDILFTVVDGLGVKDYRDVNLDEDPCIFPRCGHFQTRSSMDQQLGIQDLYDLAEEGVPSSIKGVVRPFSVKKVARCTQCRGSLRDISRYGRIIRRPMLDESVKEVLTWSNRKLFVLATLLNEHMSDLWGNTNYRSTPASSNHQSHSMEVKGNIQSQIAILRDSIGGGRYADLANWYRDIQSFSRELSAKEEVFRKVADLTRRANEKDNAGDRLSGCIHLKEPLIQPRGDLIAINLSLRCNIAILADFLNLWKEEITTGTSPRPSLQFDMTSNFRGCRDLIKQAREANRPILEAQGHLYFALFCGFALALGVETLTQMREPMPVPGWCSETEMPEFPFKDEDLRNKGLRSIAKASDNLAGSHLVIWHLIEEKETTERFIHEGCLDEEAGFGWYTAVTETLIGTSPWHACGNGHPFMGQSPRFMFLTQPWCSELLCPECDSIVAGHSRASEEEAPPDTEVSLPCQEETLVDI